MTISYRLDDYDYELPGELIAQQPSPRREDCRLLVLERFTGRVSHHHFSDLVECLGEKDVLVLNDTRVVPARLYGSKATGGRVELLILNPDQNLNRNTGIYRCLVKCSKKPRVGTRLILSENVHATVVSPVEQGQCYIRLETDRPLMELLDEIGHMPLPPYIRRGSDRQDDRNFYQTVYARRPGAIAAPTAGLHFSDTLLRKLQRNRVELVWITLHVGYGSFNPIRVKDIREHRMHPEYVEISAHAAQRLNEAKKRGKRIVAVGTTVVRALEWSVEVAGEVQPLAGLCDYYIYPGHRFRAVDALITNFHLPKSSLLLLVCAFAGRDEIMAAYREAIQRGYRFYSYGDAMLIV